MSFHIWENFEPYWGYFLKKSQKNFSSLTLRRFPMHFDGGVYLKKDKKIKP